jgi:hypothetical protein
MNSYISLQGFLIFALSLCLIFLCTSPLLADTCFGATFLQEVAGNRSKIIQLSIVFVLVGIALLFKK